MNNLTFSISPDIAVSGRSMSIGGKMLEGYESPVTATIVKRLQSAGAKLVANNADFMLVTDAHNTSKYKYRFRPSYGVVSRYGIAARGSSIDVVNIAAHDLATIVAALQVISGIDADDSISINLPTKKTDKPRVGLSNIPLDTIAHAVLEVIYSAELASNFYRYDGIRFGFRAAGANNLADLYGMSRDQGLSDSDKQSILFGTFAIGAGKYDKYFVQAQKVRTLIINSYADAFKNLDVLTVDDPSAAVLAGLPILLTPEGKHLVGARLSDFALLGVEHV